MNQGPVLVLNLADVVGAIATCIVLCVWGALYSGFVQPEPSARRWIRAALVRCAGSRELWPHARLP